MYSEDSRTLCGAALFFVPTKYLSQTSAILFTAFFAAMLTELTELKMREHLPLPSFPMPTLYAIMHVTTFSHLLKSFRMLLFLTNILHILCVLKNITYCTAGMPHAKIPICRAKMRINTKPIMFFSFDSRLSRVPIIMNAQSEKVCYSCAPHSPILNGETTLLSPVPRTTNVS